MKPSLIVLHITDLCLAYRFLWQCKMKSEKRRTRGEEQKGGRELFWLGMQMQERGLQGRPQLTDRMPLEMGTGWKGIVAAG